MNHLKKNRWKPLPFLIVLILTGVISCHFNRTAPGEVVQEPEPDNEPVISGVLTLDTARLDSIRVIYTADETRQATVPESAWPDINRLLESAVYDTEWNDSGIMLTMIAQDYALILAYKDQPQEENDWLLVWRTRDKIKYRNAWYLVNKDIKNNLCDKMETWK